jgi:uncharacterized LabA/DUF88 family protein
MEITKEGGLAMSNFTTTRKTEKLAVFVDYDDIKDSLWNAVRPGDVLSLRDFLSRGRELSATFLYTALDKPSDQTKEHFVENLTARGVIIRTGAPSIQSTNSHKESLNVRMFVDATSVVDQERPDVVLLVAADAYFASLACWLRWKGVRVEVAFVSLDVSHDLREAADEFIDLLPFMGQIEGVWRRAAN